MNAVERDKLIDKLGVQIVELEETFAVATKEIQGIQKWAYLSQQQMLLWHKRWILLRDFYKGEK